MIWATTSFLQPALLAGLLALPVIWWLLRFTPPRPKRVVFPPTRMLAGLQPDERTPAHSPLWLTILRMMIATLIILALAEPVMNTGAMDAGRSRPTLLVVDNDWAAASRWRPRQEMIEAVIRRAESQNQTVTLVLTADLPRGWTPEPLEPARLRRRTASLAPEPFAADHGAVQQALDRAFPPPAEGLFDVVWLSDGVDHGATSGLAAVLKRLGGAGEPTIVADAPEAAPLGLQGAFNTSHDTVNHDSANHDLVAHVFRPGGGARSGVVQAVSSRGARLGEAAFTFAAGEPAAEAVIRLPLELRNQVDRLEISGESSAAAVHMLDSRSQQRRVGIISGESREIAQPLLSPTHYLEKALTSSSEVVLSRTRNLDSATEEQLGRTPSALALANVGTLTGQVGLRLKGWVEKGGVLIRFAGPRLEKGGDALLPLPLREGGRSLGGALSWQTPQRLAPFEKTSPYDGLDIPPDVRINRQVLAEPGDAQQRAQIWARLEDGTPLVTAARRGEGWVVLFHVTANSDWSNLPLSGLFVEMLKRTVELSAAAADQPGGSPSAAAEAGAADAGAGEQGQLLAPSRLLDGFGRIVTPPPTAVALPRDRFAAARPGPAAPPGLYGPPGHSRALNIMTANAMLKPFDVNAAGGRTAGYDAQKPVLLAPWLWAAAFALFAVDALAAFAVMAGAPFLRRHRRAPATLSSVIGAALAFGAILALIMAGASGLQAQASPGDDREARAASSSDDRFALDAALGTRLAYVTTGDAAIDTVSREGLTGLSRVLAARTAVEPGEPMAVEIDQDELAFFPLLYWPVRPDAGPLSDKTLAKVDAYMKQGGMIIFDTRDYQSNLSQGFDGAASPALANLIGRLDLPRIEPVPERHVLSKSFYLLHTFPGRWDGGQLWVEAQPEEDEGEGDSRRAMKSDGVSSIIVTSNDLAAAWAVDEANRPLYAAVPGGEAQREMAYRVGVNIVMYALTGNYKADQVHVPALLERLGQ